MTKKTDEIEAAEVAYEEAVAAKGPRIAHDYLREDLNELRDAVNELFARGY